MMANPNPLVVWQNGLLVFSTNILSKSSHNYKLVNNIHRVKNKTSSNN